MAQQQQAASAAAPAAAPAPAPGGESIFTPERVTRAIASLQQKAEGLSPSSDEGRQSIGLYMGYHTPLLNNLG